MLLNYININALLGYGSAGDKSSFLSELNEAIALAQTAGDDDAVAQLSAFVAAKNSSDIDDRSKLSTSKELFSRKLASYDDMPVGLTLLKTNADLKHVILSDTVKDILVKFIDEQEHNEKYVQNGLAPRNRIMLFGPPGNGKTQVTKALANKLGCPLYMVRYDALISQQPGETSKRLRALFDYAKTHRCILFFDEIDAIGKDRGDENESSEMKRVVSMLLVQLDDVPGHVMVVGATNHAKAIDKAIQRRFQLRVVLPQPTTLEYVQYLNMCFGKYGHSPFANRSNRIDEMRIIALALEPENFADTEVFVEDCHRAWIRDDKQINIELVIERCLDSWADTRSKIPS